LSFFWYWASIFDALITLKINKGLIILKILLTGATGFIGKEVLKNCLLNNIDVLALIRNKNNISDNNLFLKLSDVTESKIQGCDVIIHLAGIAHSPKASYEDYQRDNVLLTLQLANQAVKAKIKRFIFVSTINVYGHSTQGNVFCTKDSPNPESNYAKSKLEAEEGLTKLAKETGLEVVIIRSTLVYGPSVPGNFDLLIKLVNKYPVLPFGLVNNKRGFVAVQNLVDLIFLCAKHPKAVGQIFIASDCKMVSIKELTNSIANSFGRKRIQLPIPVCLMQFFSKLIGKSMMVEQLVGDFEVDSSNTYELLGWVPQYTMDEAMTLLALSTIETTQDDRL